MNICCRQTLPLGNNTDTLLAETYNISCVSWTFVLDKCCYKVTILTHCWLKNTTYPVYHEHLLSTNAAIKLEYWHTVGWNIHVRNCHKNLYTFVSCVMWLVPCLFLSCLMTKPTKWLCAQRRLRSAWASTQSDQSLHCPHEESLGP